MKISQNKFVSFSENFESQFKSKFEIFAHAFHAYHNSPYDEVIHDIRVYSRRLSEPVHIFSLLKPGTDITSFIGKTRDIRTVLSAYRDLEVIRSYLVNETVGCDEEDLKFHFRILNHIEESLIEKKSEVDIAVSGFGMEEAKDFVNTVCEEVKRLQASAGENFRKPARNAVRKMILTRERSVLKHSEKAKKSKHPDQLHKLRIEIKKVRYALEFIHELGLADFSKQIKRYTKIQQLLGTYCDMLLLINFLSDAADIQSEYSDSHYFIDYCRKLSRKFGRNRDKLMKKALGFNYGELMLLAD